MSRIIGIDLFCGIGGLTHGLYKAGIEIRAGFDIDATCRKSFTQNENGNPDFILGDIKKIDDSLFSKYFCDLTENDFKLVAGCAPCQPYSSHQKKKDFVNRSMHKSYGLIKEYLRVVNLIKPHFVVMENVRQLKNDPFFKEEFLKYFQENNYFVDFKVIDMANYGAPQRRKRLLFLAVSKQVRNYKNFTIDEMADIESKNVFDAIGNLKSINAGETDPDDFLHCAPFLSSLNIKRIKASREGGTWKEWPYELLPDCYKKESGKTYLSVYGRMDRKKVSPTLTTQFNRYGTGRYGHFEQNRAISLREGAILQTFPINYVFDEKLSKVILARQIGNAVPPIFAKVIGKKIIKNI